MRPIPEPLVGVEGIEPTLLAERDFESRASTSSATPPNQGSGNHRAGAIYLVGSASKDKRKMHHVPQQISSCPDRIKNSGQTAPRVDRKRLTNLLDLRENCSRTALFRGSAKEKTPVIRRLYDWTMAQAGRRNAQWILALVAFIESSVFPIPPDVLLIPMILADRRRAWQLAVLCTVASVIGGFLGYAIGALLFDAVAEPLLSFYGYLDKFTTFQDWYVDWGAWIVFFAGLSPFPYKVITIASGVAHLDLLVFAVASVLARGMRFFIVAGLLWKFGPPIRSFIENHLGKLTIIFFLLLFGGFLALKLV